MKEHTPSADIAALFSRHPVVKALTRKANTIKAGDTLYAEGLQGSSAAVVMSALAESLAQEKCFLIILNDHDEAAYFYNDVLAMLGDKKVAFFPSPYRRDVKYAQIDASNEILRTDVLCRLNGKTPMRGIVVTYPEALAVKVVTRASFDDHTLTFAVGEEYDFSRIEKKLFDCGFRHVDYVYEPGEFAIRGSILDIFSYSCENPYRIDFFGNEVDSIRTFDVQTQLSIDKINTATIVPLVAVADDNRVSLFRFMPADTILVQRNPRFVADTVSRIYSEGFSQQALIERSELAAGEQISEVGLNSDRLLLSGEDFLNDVNAFPSLVLSARPVADSSMSVGFSTLPQPIFHKNFEIINQTFADYLSRGYRIYILADNSEQHQRLSAIFAETEADIAFTPLNIALHSGFVDDSLKACFFTDHQIFDRFHRYQLKTSRVPDGKLAHSLRDFHQFEPGDYVTHIDHGIGQFVGLVRVQDGHSEQEKMKLVYKNGDIVYVSVHSLSKVSKYKSKDGEPPSLSRLGTGAWTQLKERTKTKIKDIARDLISLYAERRRKQGFAFSPDSYMQHELEASFIYEDTPDQLKITTEIKRDMESPRPMDRLICGDVGFGKTELAIRAAFKAAVDGKQVAVLVPTTLLAYQHYITFSERLANLPVTVEYLSRAQSPKKTKEICSLLAEGKIEIVIGTHKLLGKSVKFKDLGLLIIDEEQKFGVATKERLRQLKVNVDTLTLTATPIPRTLQFSLMGARDLSVLSTPPANRYPIHTELHTFSHEVIADAINFELSRKGQVFFVCNRISSLPHIESIINQYVPDARVAIGHGRLSPDQLERTITDFMQGEYDVLLSTTIVENGIDIPNANTIIIDNAQNFGLSDLHQMRGRVGRSTRKAFCYLLTPPFAALSTESRRRLEAIEGFSDLGSGIQIAMQDLDIRGAGNLLGAEQSGFIADLGYETYQKILSEAVSELKNEEFADLYADEIKHTNDLKGDLFVDDCALESDLPLYLPEDYIPGSSERVQIYREIDSLTTDHQLDAYRLSLQDRFGPLPQPVEGLLKVPVARQMARSLGVERMVAKNGSLTLYFVSNLQSAYYQSETFGRIITYATQHFRTCRLAEHSGRRRLTIESITDIDSLFSVLQEMSSK